MSQLVLMRQESKKEHVFQPGDQLQIFKLPKSLKD